MQALDDHHEYPGESYAEGERDSDNFANPENIADCQEYINQALATLGVPYTLDLKSNDPYDTATTCNCLYALVQQRYKDVEYKEMTTDQQAKIRTDLYTYELQLTRYKERLEQQETEIGTRLVKERNLVDSHTTQMEKLSAERDAFQKKFNSILQKQSQLQHEIRKKERENEKLKERLGSMTLPEKTKKGGGFSVDSSPRTPRTPATPLRGDSGRRSSVGGEEDLYKMLYESSEAKHKELMQTNHQMTATIATLREENKELTSAKTEMKTDLKQPLQDLRQQLRSKEGQLKDKDERLRMVEAQTKQQQEKMKLYKLQEQKLGEAMARIREQDERLRGGHAQSKQLREAQKRMQLLEEQLMAATKYEVALKEAQRRLREQEAGLQGLKRQEQQLRQAQDTLQQQEQQLREYRQVEEALEEARGKLHEQEGRIAEYRRGEQHLKAQQGVSTALDEKNWEHERQRLLQKLETARAQLQEQAEFRGEEREEDQQGYQRRLRRQEQQLLAAQDTLEVQERQLEENRRQEKKLRSAQVELQEEKNELEERNRLDTRRVRELSNRVRVLEEEAQAREGSETVLRKAQQLIVEQESQLQEQERRLQDQEEHLQELRCKLEDRRQEPPLPLLKLAPQFPDSLPERESMTFDSNLTPRGHASPRASAHVQFEMEQSTAGNTPEASSAAAIDISDDESLGALSAMASTQEKPFIFTKPMSRISMSQTPEEATVALRHLPKSAPDNSSQHSGPDNDQMLDMEPVKFDQPLTRFSVAPATRPKLPGIGELADAVSEDSSSSDLSQGPNQSEMGRKIPANSTSATAGPNVADLLNSLGDSDSDVASTKEKGSGEEEDFLMEEEEEEEEDSGPNKSARIDVSAFEGSLGGNPLFSGGGGAATVTRGGQATSSGNSQWAESQYTQRASRFTSMPVSDGEEVDSVATKPQRVLETSPEIPKKDGKPRSRVSVMAAQALDSLNMMLSSDNDPEEDGGSLHSNVSSPLSAEKNRSRVSTMAAETINSLGR
eukprot:gene2347-3075_t